jgi:hypothetical protein
MFQSVRGSISQPKVLREELQQQSTCVPGAFPTWTYRVQLPLFHHAIHTCLKMDTIFSRASQQVTRQIAMDRRDLNSVHRE